jgi:uracil-DNA glycosylase
LGQSSAVCRKPLALNPKQTAAQWLIVVDDDAQSAELMSAPALDLLGKMLASVGKSWETVSATTLLKCAHAKTAAVDAFSPHVQACQVFLQQQIAIVKPQLIVAMGTLAAQALVGVDDELSSLLGEVHEFAGLPLLVMQHPDDLRQQPQLKAQAWRDLNSM